MIKSIYRFLNPKFQNLFIDYPVDMHPRYGHGKSAHKGLYDIIDNNRADYKALIDLAIANKENLWNIKKSSNETDQTKPTWNNGFLPGLDIIGIYTLLAHFKPKNYIEVGSGNSTKVAYKAKQEHHLDTKIISIDPQPRAEIDQLADEVIRMPYENIDFDVVDRLEANDVLFIDNSHRILPNSDSMVFFMETLPRLKKGVIVHIHDIYLPYDYPQFMCDRAYSEQYGLAFYLLANPEKYKPLFPNYFISEDAELAAQLAPIWEQKHLKGVERHGGSFWVRVC